MSAASRHCEARSNSEVWFHQQLTLHFWFASSFLLATTQSDVNSVAQCQYVVSP